MVDTVGLIIVAWVTSADWQDRDAGSWLSEYPTDPTSKLMKISESVLKLRRKLS